MAEIVSLQASVMTTAGALSSRPGARIVGLLAGRGYPLLRRVVDAFRPLLAELERMEVPTALVFGLGWLDLHPVCICPGVSPDTAQLPRHGLMRPPSGDRETAVGTGRLDVELRRRGADRGELIPEVASERIDIAGQLDDGRSARVELPDAVVQALH